MINIGHVELWSSESLSMKTLTFPSFREIIRNQSGFEKYRKPSHFKYHSENCNLESSDSIPNCGKYSVNPQKIHDSSIHITFNVMQNILQVYGRKTTLTITFGIDRCRGDTSVDYVQSL